MTNDARSSADNGKSSVDSVSIEEAFMDIPDAENEAMIDARLTTIVTLITTVVFVGVVFLFIL